MRSALVAHVAIDRTAYHFDKPYDYLVPFDMIEGAKVGRGIYNPDGEVTGSESGAVLEYQRALLAHGKSRLVARPIKPIDDELEVYELPSSFTREDLNVNHLTRHKVVNTYLE